MAKKKSSTNRIIFILLGVIVLFVVGMVGLRAAGVLGEKDESTAVEIAQVETRNVTQTVTSSGRVQPEIEVSISPDVPGEIVQLPIIEGDYVNQGTLLARIKQEDYLALVERSQASVLQSKAIAAQRKADLLNTELELQRQTDLYDKQAISLADLQRAQTQYEVAKASFEAAEYAVLSAEAQLKESNEQLDKTAIYAPMSGTISMLEVELGERVVGTSQMAGTEMMRLAKLDQMEMEVDVNENDVVNVALGDSAMIEVDAYPNRQFMGIVTEIANSARVNAAGTQEQVTNFPVKIRIVDRHNVLQGIGQGGEQALSTQEVLIPEAEVPNFRPGMSGTVDIFTNTVEDAIVVPIQAVTVRDFNNLKQNNRRRGGDGEQNNEEEEVAAEDGEGGEGEEGGSEEEEADMPAIMAEDLRQVVFLMEEGIAKMVEVETGISDDTHIEIRAGLNGGETVIIGPYSAVSRTLEPDTEVREDSRAARRFGPPGS